MDSQSVLVVFTAKTVAQMLDAGGTQSWVLNPRSMRGVGFVVCTRNDWREHDVECGPRTEPRNAAFMVGRVGGIRKVETRNGRDRYLVEFSGYAEVMVPGFRAGTTRNPVTYSDVGECRSRGVDVDALDFLPMPSESGRASAYAVRGGRAVDTGGQGAACAPFRRVRREHPDNDQRMNGPVYGTAPLQPASTATDGSVARQGRERGLERRTPPCT